MVFAPLMEIELKVLVEQIRALNKSVAKLEDTIKKEGATLPGHKNLKGIKGIKGIAIWVRRSYCRYLAT